MTQHHSKPCISAPSLTSNALFLMHTPLWMSLTSKELDLASLSIPDRKDNPLLTAINYKNLIPNSSFLIQSINLHSF